MSSAPPHVVAVVLNWNGADETLECVRSVGRSDWPRLTVLVVDNGSREDIGSLISERSPETLFIRNSENLGFAGGMNVGMRRARELGADYILLLNNDTVVDPAMVRVLVQTAADHPDAGMVCPLVLSRSQPEMILSAGLNCDLRRGYQGPPLRHGQQDQGQLEAVREVNAPAGAAMLVRAGVLDLVGLLDTELFLYGEDVEWAARMREAGLAVYVASRARLWHSVSLSSGGAGSPLIAYYLVRNSLFVTARHAPLPAPRALLRAAEILIFNLLHARRAHAPLVYAWAVLAGWRDYRRGQSGPAPSGLLCSLGEQTTDA